MSCEKPRVVATMLTRNVFYISCVLCQVDPVSTSDGDDDDGKMRKGGSGDATRAYVNTTKSLQTYTSTCPRHCLTAMFPSSIRITQAINHMHHLGRRTRFGCSIPLAESKSFASLLWAKSK